MAVRWYYSRRHGVLLPLSARKSSFAELVATLSSQVASADGWNAFEQSDAAAAPAATAASPAAAGGDLWADFSSQRTSGTASAAKPVVGPYPLTQC